VHRLAAGYLALQAVLGVAWWAALLASPAIRSWFELMPERHSGLDAFFFADVVMFIGGSASSAIAIVRRWSTAPLLTAFTAGGTAYATLHLAGWVLLERSGAVGMVPMAAATVLTSAIAVWIRGEDGSADVVG